PLGAALIGKPSLSDTGVIYRADRETLNIPADDSGALTFTGELNGATIRKRIEMRGNRYDWNIDVEVVTPPAGCTRVVCGWEEGRNPAGPPAAEVVFDSVVVLQENKLHSKPFTGLDAGELLQGNVEWVAFSGRYFLAALVPQGEAQNTLRAWAKRTEQTVEAPLLFPPGVLATRVEAYAGPKEIDLLEQAGYGLRRAIDLGWVTLLAVPVLLALRLPLPCT